VKGSCPYSITALIGGGGIGVAKNQPEAQKLTMTNSLE
jgi:hypothetical protein